MIVEINIFKDVAIVSKIRREGKEKNINEIKDNEMILDIGSKTISSIKQLLKIEQYFGMGQQVTLKIQISKMGQKKY